MTTPENPWETAAGRSARQAELRLLAGQEGVIGEFATEVLAGRADLRAIVYSSILPEEALGDVRSAVDQWHELPEDEKEALTANWQDTTARMIEAYNAIPEPPAAPPEQEEEDDWVFRWDR